MKKLIIRLVDVLFGATDYAAMERRIMEEERSRYQTAVRL